MLKKTWVAKEAMFPRHVNLLASLLNNLAGVLQCHFPPVADCHYSDACTHLLPTSLAGNSHCPLGHASTCMVHGSNQICVLKNLPHPPTRVTKCASKNGPCKSTALLKHYHIFLGFACMMLMKKVKTDSPRWWLVYWCLMVICHGKK